MATAVENGAGGDEQEVRWVDQERINEFGCLNNRLNELRADLQQITEDMEKLDDATSEMMLSNNGKFMILMGEAFIECDEDYITEYCEEKIEVSDFLFCFFTPDFLLIGEFFFRL
jgi:chaperonin cofactor prefoldin